MGRLGGFRRPAPTSVTRLKHIWEEGGVSAWGYSTFILAWVYRLDNWTFPWFCDFTNSTSWFQAKFESWGTEKNWHGVLWSHQEGVKRVSLGWHTHVTHFQVRFSSQSYGQLISNWIMSIEHLNVISCNGDRVGLENIQLLMASKCLMLCPWPYVTL